MENIDFKKEKPNLNELKSLIQGIKKYNEQHNYGSSVGSRIVESAMGSLDSKIDPEKDFNLLKQENSHVLNNVGIDIEPVKDKSIETEINFSEIKININEPNSFISFLNSLDENSLKKEDADSLRSIGDSLADQIQGEYELDNGEDDRLLNLFSCLEEIIKNYKRLDPKYDNGLLVVASRLEGYLTASRESYLHEYILVELKHVMPNDVDHSSVGSDGLNPSRKHWEIRIPNEYTNYWDKKIFNTLDSLKKNPNAANFYDKMLRYANESIEYAKNDCDSMLSKKDFSSMWLENIEPPEMEKHLIQIRERMEIIQKKLENYKYTS